MTNRGLLAVGSKANVLPLRRMVALAAAVLLAVCAWVAPGLAFDGPQAGGNSAPTAVPAARYAKNVVIISIHRQIDAVMAKSVKRRLEIAKVAGADAVVIDLNTPGGELGSIKDICNLIKQSSISNTVAWINPEAYSGGAVIALACREIVVADYATMGDSLIISMNSFGMYERLDETGRQKFLGPLLAEVVDSARRRGYDEKLVQGMVTRGVELWLLREKATGRQVFVGPEEYRLAMGAEPSRVTPAVPSAAGEKINWGAPGGGGPGAGGGGGGVGVAGSGASGVAADQPYVPAAEGMPRSLQQGVESSLAGLEMKHGAPQTNQRPVFTKADPGNWEVVEYVADGKGVITLKTDRLLKYGLASQTVKTEQELQAFFGATQVRRLDQSWSETLVVAMTNWMVRAVLIVVFLVSLFIEMFHPGAVLPGSIAAVMLIALLAPPFLNNMANWWEIAAIAVGILFLALEVFVLPGFGVFGVLGLLLLFGGLVGTFTNNNEGLFPDTAQGKQDLLHGVVTLALSTVTSSVAIYYVSKHFGSLPIVNRLLLKDETASDDGNAGLLAAMGEESELTGQMGVAVTPLRPAGRVQVGDRILDVVAEMGFIPAGARVRVVSVGEFRTTVEEVGGAADRGEA